MVNDLNNITKEQFDFMIRFSAKSNILFEVELPMLIYFPYLFAKIDLPQLLQEGKVDQIIKRVCEERSIEPKETTVAEIIPVILWLKSEYEAIQKLEAEHLSVPPDPEMIAAGVQELNELGEINVIDSLAGGDILKWELIERLPYHKVFDKLQKNIIENKINKAYHKLISSKKK